LAQIFLTHRFTLVPGTRIESRPWSSNTPSWVRSSEPALSGFESGLFVAAMRSMTRRPRSHCIGFANWQNKLEASDPRAREHSKTQERVKAASYGHIFGCGHCCAAFRSKTPFTAARRSNAELPQ